MGKVPLPHSGCDSGAGRIAKSFFIIKKLFWERKESARCFKQHDHRAGVENVLVRCGHLSDVHCALRPGAHTQLWSGLAHPRDIQDDIAPCIRSVNFNNEPLVYVFSVILGNLHFLERQLKILFCSVTRHQIVRETIWQHR